jgi:hypothetical protein
MSRVAGAAPATDSRSRIPVAARSVRAVSQRIEGAAVGAGMLAAQGEGRHREVAALAGGGKYFIPTEYEGPCPPFRKPAGKIPRIRSG